MPNTNTKQINELNTFYDYVTKSEEKKEHPYADSKGLITTAAGVKVNSWEEFKKIPFKYEEGKKQQRLATQAEIKTGWDALEKERRAIQKDPKRSFNLKADHFLDKTNLRHTDQDIRNITLPKVQRAINTAKTDLGEEAWNKLSLDHKKVAVDVAYASGNLAKNFPNLTKALKEGDSTKIASESHFYSGENEDGSPKRNWDRIRRNHATALGLDPDSQEAMQSIYDYYYKRDGMEKLPRAYKDFKSSKRAEPQQEKDLKGGSANDTLSTPTLPQKDPEVEEHSKWFEEQMTKPGDVADGLLSKQMEDLTEEEVHSLMKTPAYQSSTDPRREKTAYTVKNWYEHHYGTDKVARDETGKMVEPTFKIAPPKDKQPQKAGNGEPMEQAVKKLGTVLGMAAKTEGKEEAVKGLQQGLNLLNDKLKAPHKAKASEKLTTSFIQPTRLKDDGILGNKTRDALKTSVADHGPEKIKDGLALGRLANFTAQTQKAKKPPQPLAQAVDKAIGSLYGKEARSMGQNLPNGRRSTLWGEAIQHDLNDQGNKLYKTDWEQLKPDGDLGPKTEATFIKLAQNKDPLDMASSFGCSLGFWD